MVLVPLVFAIFSFSFDKIVKFVRGVPDSRCGEGADCRSAIPHVPYGCCKVPLKLYSYYRYLQP